VVGAVDALDALDALAPTTPQRSGQPASHAGWCADRFTPLLAGVAELLPWVRQWHGSYDEEWGAVPAEDIGAFLTDQRARHQLTEEALHGWRSEPTRCRRAT
jgi:hypothetical protein